MKLDRYMKREKLDDRALSDLSRRRSAQGVGERTVRTARKGEVWISFRKARAIVKATRGEVDYEDLVPKGG